MRLDVERLGDAGEIFVGLFFFVLGFFEQVNGFLFVEQAGPGLERAVEGDFVVLDLLGVGDDAGVLQNGVEIFADEVLGFLR